MDDQENYIRHFLENAKELSLAADAAKGELPKPEPGAAEQVKEEREERMSQLPPIIPGDEFPAKWEIPPVDYLVDGFIAKNELALLSGPSKSFKTWIWLNVAVATAAGIPIFNRETKKSKTLVIDLELKKERVQERLIDIALARGLDGVPPNLHLWSLARVTYDLDLIIESLKAELLDQEPYDFIILDPAYVIDTKDGEFDENSSQHVTKLLQALEGLVKESDACLAITHHFRKGNPNSSDALDRAAGSGSWSRYSSLLLTATRHEEEDCLIIETTSRNQKSPEPFVIQFAAPLITARPDLNPTKHRKYGEPPKARFDPASIVMNHVPKQGRVGRNKLYFLCSKDGLNEAEFKEAINSLLEKDLCFVEDNSHPNETIYYYL